MLEQAGAKVDVVEDGLQAVEAINNILNAEKAKRTSLLHGSQPETSDSPRYDLILMDCQVRYHKNAKSHSSVSFL